MPQVKGASHIREDKGRFSDVPANSSCSSLHMQVLLRTILKLNSKEFWTKDLTLPQGMGRMTGIMMTYVSFKFLSGHAINMIKHVLDNLRKENAPAGRNSVLV